MDIKETLEVFDAADAGFEAITKVCEDGKVGILDIRHLLDPIKATQVALAGREKLKDELKDLDQGELEQIAVRAVRTAEKAAAAIAAIGDLKA